MMIQLSDREASILLGATLMHWGVPFRSVTKRALTDPQQAVVDAASEKLIALREAYQQPQLQGVQSVQLSDHEIALLIEVVDHRPPGVVMHHHQRGLPRPGVQGLA
jgi:hypothetical protein